MNQDAMNMYSMFIELSHAWDDIVDGDKNIQQEQINQAFLTALVYLPSNPFYRRIQEQILPMWMTFVSAYEVANNFEKNNFLKTISPIKEKDSTCENEMKAIKQNLIWNLHDIDRSINIDHSFQIS